MKKDTKNQLRAKLEGLTALQVWLFSTLFAVLTALSIVSLMALLLKGEVTNDYIITGLVTSLFVAGLVAGLVICLLNKQSKNASSALLQNLTTAAPLGVALVRPMDGQFIYTNPSFNEMTGYTADELASQLHWPVDFIEQGMIEKILDSIATEGFWKGDLQKQTKSGVAIWTATHVMTLPHPEYGELWMIYESDISEQKNRQ